MPGGRTKFQAKWLEILDDNNELIGNWCTKGKNDYEAYCLMCKSSISVANRGISQVMQHAAKQKHIKIMKQLKGQKTLSSGKPFCETSNSMMCSASNTVSLRLTTDQLVTKAEALWAMKVAVSNFSFESSKDIVPLFNAMFEGHPVSSKMQLGARKLSYVLSHGLGPYFHAETLQDIKSAIKLGRFFTLSFDETTTSQIKKQLDIYVRFWSEKHNQVVSSYLTSLFLGHADASTVCRQILNSLEVDGLPLNKVLMIGMDGPYVNLLISKKLNEELLKSGSSTLIDIDTCSLHKVHNCFSKALDTLPLDIDEFANDLFSFFKLSSAHRKDLQNLEKLCECEELFLKRHVSSRWLSLGPVVSRILTVYSALQEYFLKFLPKQKASWGTVQHNSRYKRIVEALKNKETVVYLEFIAALTPLLQSYLSLFQLEGPLVHLLHSKMSDLLRNILLKFMKEDCVGNREGKNLMDIDMENFENYKQLKQLDVGIGTRRALSSLTDTQCKEARMSIRSCLVKLAKLLKKSLPIDNHLLKDLENLHPFMREVQNNDSIRRLCVNMKPLNMTDSIIDKVMLEWQTYRLDPDVNALVEDFKSEEKQRIDSFWKKVFDVKEKFSGRSKYLNLATLVKCCLSLSHGNADVERGFSFNNSILSDNRLSLSESTLIGIRHVKDAVKKHGNIFSVPITAKLLNSVVKSHSLYIAEKEKEKAAEELKMKRKSEEEEMQQQTEAKKQKMKNNAELKDINNKIKVLQNDLTSANKCLAEGNKKLCAALNEKDYTCAKIVSTMIDASTNDIQRITKELSAAQEKLNLMSSNTS